MNQIPAIQMPRNQTSSNGNQMPRQDLGRWVYVEAGAAAETYFFRSCLWIWPTYTAGFDANKTGELLGLPTGEVPIGVLPVGRKA